MFVLYSKKKKKVKRQKQVSNGIEQNGLLIKVEQPAVKRRFEYRKS